MAITDLENEVLKLSTSEKKRLLRQLIEDLDADGGENVDQVWLEEAQRRHKELKDGMVQAVSADNAIAEAREGLHNGRGTTS